MASLRIVKGHNQGQELPLTTDRVTFGRNPECTVVIPATSVSREHAQLLRVNGRWFVEDLKSRNHTYLNNVEVAERTPLKHNDRLRICDFQAVFLDPQPVEDDDEGESSTTVEASVSHSSNLILETQPAEKLKALLDISGNLSRTLELEALLPKVCDSLFLLFKQADRAFVIFSEGLVPTASGDQTLRLVPKVIRTRRPADEANARFSKSIVRQTLETAQAFLSEDASQDKRIPLSQSVLDFRIRSVMCTPLVGSEGRPFGVIQVDTQDRTKKFTQDDLKLLVGVGNQASVAMQNARFHAESVARERLRRDLELAHQVQHSFLPPEPPQVPGYEFFAAYEPAQEVGGDYYGFVPLANQKVGFAVGDVAGKGIPAALMMAKLSSDTRLCLLTEPDPARAISRLNDMLYPHTSQLDRFVTLAGAVLDPTRHVVTVVSAGHQPPQLYRAAARTLTDAAPKDVGGLPLGMLEGFEYASCNIALQPGDCLLVYTDGVPDAVNVREEQFTEKGVQAAVMAGPAFNARAVGERLLKAVRAHGAGRSQFDDITLVCLSRNA